MLRVCILLALIGVSAARIVAVEPDGGYLVTKIVPVPAILVPAEDGLARVIPSTHGDLITKKLKRGREGLMAFIITTDSKENSYLSEELLEENYFNDGSEITAGSDELKPKTIKEIKLETGSDDLIAKLYLKSNRYYKSKFGNQEKVYPYTSLNGQKSDKSKFLYDSYEVKDLNPNIDDLESKSFSVESKNSQTSNANKFIQYQSDSIPTPYDNHNDLDFDTLELSYPKLLQELSDNGPSKLESIDLESVNRLDLYKVKDSKSNIDDLESGSLSVEAESTEALNENYFIPYQSDINPIPYDNGNSNNDLDIDTLEILYPYKKPLHELSDNGPSKSESIDLESVEAFDSYVVKDSEPKMESGSLSVEAESPEALNENKFIPYQSDNDPIPYYNDKSYNDLDFDYLEILYRYKKLLQELSDNDPSKSENIDLESVEAFDSYNGKYSKPNIDDLELRSLSIETESPETLNEHTFIPYQSDNVPTAYDNDKSYKDLDFDTLELSYPYKKLLQELSDSGPLKSERTDLESVEAFNSHEVHKSIPNIEYLESESGSVESKSPDTLNAYNSIPYQSVVIQIPKNNDKSTNDYLDFDTVEINYPHKKPLRDLSDNGPLISGSEDIESVEEFVSNEVNQSKLNSDYLESMSLIVESESPETHTHNLEAIKKSPDADLEEDDLKVVLHPLDLKSYDKDEAYSNDNDSNDEYARSLENFNQMNSEMSKTLFDPDVWSKHLESVSPKSNDKIFEFTCKVSKESYPRLLSKHVGITTFCTYGRKIFEETISENGLIISTPGISNNKIVILPHDIGAMEYISVEVRSSSPAQVSVSDGNKLYISLEISEKPSVSVYEVNMIRRESSVDT